MAGATCGSKIVLSVEETREWLGALWDFVSSHYYLSEAHTVEFFVEDMWNGIFTQEWQDQLMSVRDSQYFVSPPRDGPRGVLLEFLQKAQALRLPLMTGFVEREKRSKLLSFGMKAKKSHEVGQTAEFVTQLVEQQNLQQILDIGSGKGYLSEYLALHCGFKVVGIDCQESNSQGAAERNRKVYKAWKHMRPEDQPVIPENESTKFTHLSPSSTLSICDTGTCISDTDHDCSTDTTTGSFIPDTKTTAHLDGLCQKRVSMGDYYSCVKEKSSEAVKTSSFFPVTEKVSISDQVDYEHLLRVAEQCSGGQFSASDPSCVIGLHTCGDLASMVLRLYHRVPSVRAVCVVGCCYQHISEGQEEGVNSQVGFPMSSYLQSVHARLGRNARMLALQNFSRFNEITTGTALESVFRRAILQVLLVRKFRDTYEKTKGPQPLMVGKLRHIPKDFKDYVTAATGKLGLNSGEISDAELEHLQEEFLSKKCQLEYFLKLRAVFASCIESLIILDRLLYIQEQGKSQLSCIVQLFDPELSPRCFALAACK